MNERLSLDQRLRAARDDSRPVVLPAEKLFCREYFDALSALTGSSSSLKFYHEEIVRIEQEEGRDLPLFTVVTNLLREDKMELLYQILVEPFVELKRKEDDV